MDGAQVATVFVDGDGGGVKDCRAPLATRRQARKPRGELRIPFRTAAHANYAGGGGELKEGGSLRWIPVPRVCRRRPTERLRVYACHANEGSD